MASTYAALATSSNAVLGLLQTPDAVLATSLGVSETHALFVKGTWRTSPGRTGAAGATRWVRFSARRPPGYSWREPSAWILGYVDPLTSSRVDPSDPRYLVRAVTKTFHADDLDGPNAIDRVPWTVEDVSSWPDWARRRGPSPRGETIRSARGTSWCPPRATRATTRTRMPPAAVTVERDGSRETRHARGVSVDRTRRARRIGDGVVRFRQFARHGSRGGPRVRGAVPPSPRERQAARVSRGARCAFAVSHVHARVSLRIAVSRRVGRERTSRHPTVTTMPHGHRADPLVGHVNLADPDSPFKPNATAHLRWNGTCYDSAGTSWARESGTRTTTRSNRRTSSTRTCGNPTRRATSTRGASTTARYPSRGQTSRSASRTRNQRHRRHHQRSERFSRAVRRGAPGILVPLHRVRRRRVIRPTPRRC